MKFKMKVNDYFTTGSKTIFTGELETKEKYIQATLCSLIVNGEKVSEIMIEGEINNKFSELWSYSNCNLNINEVKKQEVWLVSE